MSIRRAQTTRTTSAIAISAALGLALVGCSGNADDDEASSATLSPDQSASAEETTTEPDEETPSADESDGADASNVDDVDLADHTFDLNWTDALDQAKEEFDGDVSKIELEVEGEAYVYKVELLSDKQKFEYQIDANSGDVVEQDTDDFSDDKVKTEREKNAIDLDNVIDVEDAMQTALGERDGRVTEWKLEGKSSGPRYEFDIENSDGTDDVEIQVDAVSGDLMSRDD